jgi:RimJ/RimL family protein N-acetyltransferase
MMIKGKNVTLRPVRESDLDFLREKDLDLDNRGEFWPRTVSSEVEYRRAFQETGFWGESFGRLLITDRADQVLGEIMYFKTVQYMDELEIAYRLFGEVHWGKGVTTEALGLLTRYLFETRNVNRIRLGIDTDNKGSRRVAEKNGYKHEGTQRGGFYHRGRHHDMELYAILKDEALSS